MRPARPRPSSGLARALSKLGICSRSEARQRIQAGRVRINGVVTRDPEHPVAVGRDRIEVDDHSAQAAPGVYLMLNKPRGLVTTKSDERGRDTVFRCFEGAALPFLSAVGRLDQASEGLLLFTNDTGWAARITDPGAGIEKVYHVRVNCVADDALRRRIVAGVAEGGELLSARRAALLRSGPRNSWLEIVLDEGRNRHIRRLMAALGIEVLRLVRVAIGPLVLGPLPKGAWRHLAPGEIAALTRTPRPSRPRDRS